MQRYVKISKPFYAGPAEDPSNDPKGSAKMIPNEAQML
jgi:hypothetical protein